MKAAIEVKLPAGPQDLRIRHFGSMGHVPHEGLKTLGRRLGEILRISRNQQVVFLSEFLGLKYNQTLDFTVKDIDKMNSLAIRALSRMDLTKKLPESIVLRKQKYVLVDPDKVGIGWHIDFGACDIKKDPVRLACLFYLPEGFNYSDTDQNGNITHPISSRYDIFAEDFPLELFCIASAFFLKKSLVSIRRSTVLEIATSKSKQRISTLLRSLSPLNGKRLFKR